MLLPSNGVRTYIRPPGGGFVHAHEIIMIACLFAAKCMGRLLVVCCVSRGIASSGPPAAGYV